MKDRSLLAVPVIVMVLAGSVMYAQQFPPQGNDTTQSRGGFRIEIKSEFRNLFSHTNPPPTAPDVCPGFDPNTGILSSPSLFDPQTLIGRSAPLPDGRDPDLNGVPVGVPSGVIMPFNVSESMLIKPPGFPCKGVSPCSSGPDTPEVHTDIESLFLTGKYPPSVADPTPDPANVRAGQWYDSATTTLWPPTEISRGEVESQAGPNAPPQNFFPASSFFDVFVQVDLPSCKVFTGALPAVTLYNALPLIVKNYQVVNFPPKVVYLHDSTSVVPILFSADDPDKTFNPPRWTKDDILGYFLLVGHGVGGFAQSDFDTIILNSPNATCPIGQTGTTVATATSSTSTRRKSSPASSSTRRPVKTPRSTTKSKPPARTGNASLNSGAN